MSVLEQHTHFSYRPPSEGYPTSERPFKRVSDKAILEKNALNQTVVSDWANTQTFSTHYIDPSQYLGYFPAQNAGDFEKLDALDNDLAEKFLFLDIFVQRLQDSPNARRWKIISSKINKQTTELMIRYTDGTLVKMQKNTATGKSTAFIQSKQVKRLSVDLDTLTTV